MENVREEIIGLAMEKMRQVGIKSISIDDLCHEIGISKKTFYVYFAAKDDLIAEMLRKHEESLMNNVEQAVAGKTVLDLLLGFTYKFFTHANPPQGILQYTLHYSA